VLRDTVRLTAGAGAALLAAITLAALLVPLVLPWDPLEQNLNARLLPAFTCAGERGCHWLGTDHLGRDLLTRLLYGARISLAIGLGAIAIASTLGTAAGALAGYCGGIIDRVVMRLADAQLAIPSLLLAMAVMTLRGAGIGSLIVVLAMIGWVSYAQVVRSAVRAEREKAYVAAAQALGASHVRIVTRHVLPNVSDLVLVMLPSHLAMVLLTEAALTFVGLGIPPPAPSWGALLADGRDYATTAWWLIALPGLAIGVTAFGATILSDGLSGLLARGRAR
jgi:peptide/nickel transport system permease protein